MTVDTVCGMGRCGVREIALTLEGKPVKLDELKGNFYYFLIDDQTQYGTRVPRSQIPEIVKRAERRVDLMPAEMPFLKIYGKRGED